MCRRTIYVEVEQQLSLANLADRAKTLLMIAYNAPAKTIDLLGRPSNGHMGAGQPGRPPHVAAARAGP